MAEEGASTDEGTATDADAVAAAVSTGGEGDASFYLSEGIAGEGDAPEWFKGDKYKTVADQAKGYTELESKFGSFTGAPEEYGINISDELKEKGVEFNAEDPLMEAAIKFATEKGMNQEGFDGLVDLYAMSELAKSEAIALNRADQIKALGDNGQARLDNLNKWANANLSEGLVAGFLEAASSADAVKTLEKLVSMTRAAPLSDGAAAPTGGITEAEVKEMQFAKDDHGNRKIQTDPEFKKKYEAAMEQVYGTGERQIVIG